jgi:hypothetical protein
MPLRGFEQKQSRLYAERYFVAVGTMISTEAEAPTNHHTTRDTEWAPHMVPRDQIFFLWENFDAVFGDTRVCRISGVLRGEEPVLHGQATESVTCKQAH